MSTTMDRALAPDAAEEMTLGERLSAVETVVAACASYLGSQVNYEVWGKGTPEQRVANVQAALKELLARASSSVGVLNERLLQNLERSTGALATITEELRKRCAQPGKPQQLVKRMVGEPLASVNPTAMSARFTISTPTPDRSRDVVMPLGCDLKPYQRNPVVFFDHGQTGVTMPIGKSRDPSGRLTVYKSAAGVDAEVYFSQSSLEAAQVFALVAEGVLNAASVHLIPTKCHRLADGGLHIDEWQLLEWSVVGLPDNSEAVRKVLSKNRLAGRSIEPALAKSLRLGQVRSLLRERDTLLKEFGATLLQLKGNR